MAALKDMTKYEQVKRELQNNPKTWLITGVAGFIGSNMLETLLILQRSCWLKVCAHSMIAADNCD